MKKFFLLVLLLSGCAAPRESETSYPGVDTLTPAQLAEAKKKPDFVRHVKPILEGKCVMCHNRKTLPGLMSLETKAQAFRPGASGLVPIIPGHPEGSLLIANVKRTHANVTSMPQVGERVTANEIAILRTWIAQGANWPEGPAGRLNPDGPVQR